MTPQPAARSKAEAITSVIADRVRALRTQAGLSQEELADKMSKTCGIGWNRRTVVNLEARAAKSKNKSSPGRDSVSVQELLGLAYVLDVPVVSLLVDPMSPEPVEVGDKIEFEPWTALGWYLGQVHPGGEDRPVSDRWKSEIRLIRASIELWMARSSLDRNDDIDVLGDADYQIDALEREANRHRSALRMLARSLATMQTAGAPTPRQPEKVLARARELGVELPGVEE